MLRLMFAIFVSNAWAPQSLAQTCIPFLGVESTLSVQEGWVAQKGSQGQSSLVYFLQNRHFKETTVSLELIEHTGFQGNTCIPKTKSLGILVNDTLLVKNEVEVVRAIRDVPERCKTSAKCLVRVNDVKGSRFYGFLALPQNPDTTASEVFKTCAGGNTGSKDCSLGIVQPQYDLSGQFNGIIHVDLNLTESQHYEVSKIDTLPNALTVESVDSETLIVSEYPNHFVVHADKTSTKKHRLTIKTSSAALTGLDFFAVKLCHATSAMSCDSWRVSAFYVPMRLE